MRISRGALRTAAYGVFALVVSGLLTGCYTQLATVQDPYMPRYEKQESYEEEAPRDEGTYRRERSEERRETRDRNYRKHRYDCYGCSMFEGGWYHGSLYDDLWLWDSPWFRPGGFFGPYNAWHAWYRDPWHRSPWYSGRYFHHYRHRPYWHRPYGYGSGFSFGFSFGFSSGWGYGPFTYHDYGPFYGSGFYGGFGPFYGSGFYGGYGGYGYYPDGYYVPRKGDRDRQNYEPRGGSVGRNVGYRGPSTRGAAGSRTYRSSDEAGKSSTTRGRRIYSSDDADRGSATRQVGNRSEGSRGGGQDVERTERRSRDRGRVGRSSSDSRSSESRVESRGSSSRSSGRVGRSSGGGRVGSRSTGRSSSRGSSSGGGSRGGSSSSRGGSSGGSSDGGSSSSRR